MGLLSRRNLRTGVGILRDYSQATTYEHQLSIFGCDWLGYADRPPGLANSRKVIR